MNQTNSYILSCVRFPPKHCEGCAGGSISVGSCFRIIDPADEALALLKTPTRKALALVRGEFEELTYHGRPVDA